MVAIDTVGARAWHQHPLSAAREGEWCVIDVEREDCGSAIAAGRASPRHAAYSKIIERRGADTVGLSLRLSRLGAISPARYYYYYYTVLATTNYYDLGSHG